MGLKGGFTKYRIKRNTSRNYSKTHLQQKNNNDQGAVRQAKIE